MNEVIWHPKGGRIVSCRRIGRSNSVAVECPFCHRQHRHGIDDDMRTDTSHRFADCGDGQGNSYHLKLKAIR